MGIISRDSFIWSRIQTDLNAREGVLYYNGGVSSLTFSGGFPAVLNDIRLLLSIKKSQGGSIWVTARKKDSGTFKECFLIFLTSISTSSRRITPPQLKCFDSGDTKG